MKKFFSATVTATPATPQPKRNGYPQIFVAVQMDIPAAANDSEPPPKTPTLARRVLGSVSQFAGIVIAGVATVALVVSHHPTQAPPAKPPVAQNDNSGKRPPAKPPAAHNDTGPGGSLGNVGVGAHLAPSGRAPDAFIMHHTSGRGTPGGVVGDWRTHRPGIGTQYIMDREGDIHDIEKEFGYGGHNHMIIGSGKGAGLSNLNTVGMEVIAKDDRDVTPAQARAAVDFIARNYPHTPVFGHGEVNPGHREASEGMTIVNAIRRQRSMMALRNSGRTVGLDRRERT